MTAREVQWQSKLNHMRGYGPVHKWEKRWISKGSMMVFKWVRKAETCEFRRQTADAGEGEGMPLDEGLFEQEVGPRRLTRGKAADMGIEVGPIVDISEQALLGRDIAPRRAEEGGAGGQDAGGGGEASRKRPRENDEDGGKADAKEKDAEDGAPSKKARSEGEADGKAPEPA